MIKNKKKSLLQSLPPIPDKRYFAISEASDLCGVKAYVLRYWEQEFPTLKPIKRRGNRRYYQQGDILIIRKIRELLYERGFTIEGARVQLTSSIGSPSVYDKSKTLFNKIILDLETVLEELH